MKKTSKIILTIGEFDFHIFPNQKSLYCFSNNKPPYLCYFSQIESGLISNVDGMPFKEALDKYKKLKAFT